MVLVAAAAHGLGRADEEAAEHLGADVERLRYVLTAQRDQYLPLKVIKEQLEAIDKGVATVGAVDSVPRRPRSLAVAPGEVSPDPPSSRLPSALYRAIMKSPEAFPATTILPSGWTTVSVMLVDRGRPMSVVTWPPTPKASPGVLSPAPPLSRLPFVL